MKTGRPRLPEGTAHTSFLKIRCSEDEMHVMKQAAMAEGLNLSQWVRGRLLVGLPVTSDDAATGTDDDASLPKSRVRKSG
jgi:hypothetical protein